MQHNNKLWPSSSNAATDNLFLEFATEDQPAAERPCDDCPDDLWDVFEGNNLNLKPLSSCARGASESGNKRVSSTTVQEILASGAHLEPLEQGGLTLLQLKGAMKADARKQERLLVLIAALLDETVENNDNTMYVSGLPSFESNIACPIKASDYMNRIVQYTMCSACCIIVAVVYLERLKKVVGPRTRVYLHSYNIQRLFAVAVMLAAKYLDDLHFDNKHWAEVAGIQLHELNRLELEMLFELCFDLGISRKEYDALCDQICVCDE